VLREFELHGVDAVRAVLAGSSDGSSGISRDTLLKLGNVVASRGEMQDWLKWKDADNLCWIKAGVIAAVAAAIFAGLTFFGIHL
jgi:hypothetical protein